MCVCVLLTVGIYLFKCIKKFQWHLNSRLQTHPFEHSLFMTRSICLYPYYSHIKTRYLMQNQITFIVFGKMKSIRFARFCGIGQSRQTLGLYCSHLQGILYVRGILPFKKRKKNYGVTRVLHVPAQRTAWGETRLGRNLNRTLPLCTY